jgi:hypothetical protein
MQKELNPERREHERFKTQEGLFVNAASSFGKITDISLGGMAFNYINWHQETDKEGRLDIYQDGHDLLTDIPFKVLSENKIEDKRYSSLVSLKQCRIQFKSLDSKQKSKLADFMLHHNAGEA